MDRKLPGRTQTRRVPAILKAPGTVANGPDLGSRCLKLTDIRFISMCEGLRGRSTATIGRRTILVQRSRHLRHRHHLGGLLLLCPPPTTALFHLSTSRNKNTKITFTFMNDF